MKLAIITTLFYLLIKVLLLESDIRELKKEVYKNDSLEA